MPYMPPFEPLPSNADDETRRRMYREYVDLCMDDCHQRFNAALDDMLRESHQRGLAEGLAVARKIRDWLTRQPDREWQRQVREWADTEIAKAER